MKRSAYGAPASMCRPLSAGFALLLVVASAASAERQYPDAMTAGAGRQDPEAAVRLFADAQRLTEEGDLEAALRNYELLVQQFPQADIADDALLLTAEGRWRLDDRPGAEAAIGVLKDSYPRTSGAAGAFVLAGNIRMATAVGVADIEAAREAFRSVVLLYGRNDFPSLEWRALALVRAGEASLLLGEPRAAGAHFLSAIEDESRTQWTQPARLYLATVLMRSGEWAPGAEILQRIVDEGVTDVEKAGSDAAVVSTARRRLELGHRLLLRPSLSQLPWSNTRPLRFTGPRLEAPEGIDAGEDNRVVIVDAGVPLVAVLEPDGTLSHRVPSSDAFHPWWGRGGDPYVATRRSVLNLASRERQDFFVPVDDEMKQVEEITAGVHGIFRQWMLLDSNRKRLLLVDETAAFTSVLMGADDREPVDVAVDYRGRFYVLDRKAETVVRFAADGSEPTRIVQRDWRRPEAIAVDGLGNIYVLDRDAKTIDVFDAEGRPLWQLGPQLPGGIELKSPRDLGVDGSGRIYVADRDLKAFLVIE